MASVTGSGSQLFFHGQGQGGGTVNIDLTTTGTGTQPQPLQGKLNIEVFTSVPGSIAPGYQGSALVPGATLVDNNIVSNVGQTNVTEELLTGSYGVVDQTGHEAIEIIGSAAGGDSMSVTGSTGDTIIGSSIAGTQQLIDASGKNHLSTPGPETIVGGAGMTTVYAGFGDSIQGGSGDMLIVGGSHDTIIGGSGAITIKGGAGDSVVAGTGGIISVHGKQGPQGKDDPGESTIAGDHQGEGHSSVMGFGPPADPIHSATSASLGGQFVGSSHSSADGTMVHLEDGSSTFLAGVVDPGKIPFLK